jgi:hypothetical protein
VERKKVDLSGLPRWAQYVVAVSTVVLVGGGAYLASGHGSAPAVPISAIVAALIAFAFVAWRSRGD